MVCLPWRSRVWYCDAEVVVPARAVYHRVRHICRCEDEPQHALCRDKDELCVVDAILDDVFVHPVVRAHPAVDDLSTVELELWCPEPVPDDPHVNCVTRNDIIDEPVLGVYPEAFRDEVEIQSRGGQKV